MNLTLYRCSLFVALPLVYFFGFHMLLARVPRTGYNSNYLLSRRIMGSALLVLAVNYTIHFVWNIRMTNLTATILLNMATYFLAYWLFASAMTALLDRASLNRTRFRTHLLLWLAYSLLAVGVGFLRDPARSCARALMAGCLVAYGLYLSYQILSRYKRATRLFANTRSDDIGAYIRWMSVFTWWAIIFGIGCGLLTFLPDRFVFIWLLSAVPFFIYLYCCYQNYLFFHEDVERAIDEEKDVDEPVPVPEETAGARTVHTDISSRIGVWVANEGDRTPGITLNQLSLQLCTNRTYLSEHINRVYGMTFRDWIIGMRIEYAKNLMTQNPQMKIQEVAESAGFLSLSHFSRTFSEREGCSPARWRQGRK